MLCSPNEGDRRPHSDQHVGEGGTGQQADDGRYQHQTQIMLRGYATQNLEHYATGTRASETFVSGHT